MICLPEQRHPSLRYGEHWSDQMGQSGHFVRANARQPFVQAVERPDVTWGTSRDAECDDSIMTLDTARKAIALEVTKEEGASK